MSELFAHSSEQGPWEPLGKHLLAVAERAAAFAEIFGAAEAARLAGLWHDLGKGSQAFQQGVLQLGADEADSDEYTQDGISPQASVRARVDHSTAGAQHAVEVLDAMFGRILAYVIAGHHGRLADWFSPNSSASLKERLEKSIPPWETPDGIETVLTNPLPLLKRFQPNHNPKYYPFQLATLTRMLYSTLVDADRLETERFCNPEAARLRPAKVTTPTQLLAQLDRHLDRLRQQRQANPAPIDRHREAVLAACRRKAELPQGLFTLTVPTGGGKTYASMAFALKHAQHHGLRRVVYALPFTSIIEQTAATFRDVFDQPSDVLEHHSNFDAGLVYPDVRSQMAYQMAAENFDAPIVVTTNVQLFESLFSAHGSACRKLHRLAGSVIVLDEAQTIPPRLLRPTLAMICELTLNYRCTFVFCTATQPAMNHRPKFDIGFEEQNVTEIVDRPNELYEQMRRVAVQSLGKLTDDDLASRLSEHTACLCIVNTRRHAAMLAQLLKEAGDDDVVHLSAAMCPAHRSDLVRHVKGKLAQGQSCRVVSTQVIEAGVDVDFPVVYRALAGFDAIAQAAGRCNREGRQKRGDVYVFETDHQPAISLRDTIDTARALFPDYQDPLDLDAIRAYFEQLYWREKDRGRRSWDTKDVMGCFRDSLAFDFREADQRFRWIDSPTTPLVVPFGQGVELIEHLRTADEPDWTLLRRAQPFSVSVYSHEFDRLLGATAITPYLNGHFWVLNNPEGYDPILGLCSDTIGLDPDMLAL